MGAAGWHICFDVLDHLLSGTPIGRMVGGAAMKFGGWQRLNAEYARQFGIETSDWSPQRRSLLKWNQWVRQTHRWLSIAFTVTVIANFIALAQGGGKMPPPWLTYAPLLPLALLLFTGLYMFVLPYATRWRSGRST